jgi:hypothetical protein
MARARGLDQGTRDVHRKKKVREFPVPSRDVTTKLSLGGNNDVITELFLPRGSLVSDITAGDGKLVNLFLRCTLWQKDMLTTVPRYTHKRYFKRLFYVKNFPLVVFEF